MALTLECNYSKKIGLPNYSSHQFMVTLRTEVNATGDIPEEVSRLYHLLQENVDREIQHAGWLPDNQNGQPPANGSNANGNGRPAPTDADPAWACSVKQRRLIERVCREQGILDTDLEELAHARFGKAVFELNKLEASGLIDELLDTAPRSRNGRYNGSARRSSPEPAGRRAR